MGEEEPEDDWTPTVGDEEENADDEVTIFRARVLHHAIQIAAAYTPGSLFQLLDEFAYLYIIERELERERDAREVEAVHLVRAHRGATDAPIIRTAGMMKITGRLTNNHPTRTALHTPRGGPELARSVDMASPLSFCGSSRTSA